MAHLRTAGRTTRVHRVAMTTPQDDEPQPRDIAVEQPTEDQLEDLEEQSDPE
jgi:hypothetical protein